MALRGIRGATTVDYNTREEIISKTRELLESLFEMNKFRTEDIASIIFSVTNDLDAEFPALAAREIGWIYTPLFCTQEIPVQDSLKGCIRVLMHVNSDIKQQDVMHAYLHGAKKLRPDLDTNNKNKYYYSDE